jgi:hypothetical protein
VGGEILTVALHVIQGDVHSRVALAKTVMLRS